VKSSYLGPNPPPRPLPMGIHILDSPKPSHPIYALHSALVVSISNELRSSWLSVYV